MQEQAQRKSSGVGFPQAQGLLAHRSGHFVERGIGRAAARWKQHRCRECRKCEVCGGEAFADQKPAPVVQGCAASLSERREWCCCCCSSGRASVVVALRVCRLSVKDRVRPLRAAGRERYYGLRRTSLLEGQAPCETGLEVALRIHQIAKRAILATVPVASMLLARGAYAQASACDQLKLALTARIDPSIRGYTLEIMPAGVPVPSGAKVIGTCEGGARRILFRRWGATPSPANASTAVEPASAPQATAAPAQTTRRMADTQGNRAAQPAATSVSSSMPRLGSPSNEAGSSVPTPIAEPHESAAGAGGGEVARAIDRVAVQATQPQRDNSAVANVPLAQRASGFLGRYWQWMAALVLVPLAVSLRAWLAYRSAYDEAGLPRGPKLN